jgi:hypothetical protein
VLSPFFSWRAAKGGFEVSHRAAFYPRILNTGALLLCLSILLSALTGCQSAPSPLQVRLPNLSALFDINGVSITSTTGLAWRWQISAIRGEDALALNAVMPIQPSPDRVVYQRGALREEYHIASTQIEQIFRIPQPLGNGDLIIEGQVSSTANFEPAPGGWVWRAQAGVISLSDVSVFDARGVTIPATMQAGSNYTRLRIAGSDLASAVYPVTIDPEIGTNDFRISNAGPDLDVRYQAHSPALTFNSSANEFLAAWVADSVTDGQMGIYVQRINPNDGAKIGSSALISNTASGIQSPALAYNATNNQYMVVWLDRSIPPRTVKALLLDASAAPLGSVFTISSTSVTPQDPAVAYNSVDHEYLVVWAIAGVPSTIYAQRVDSVGGLQGTAINVSNPAATGTGRHPSVTYNSTNAEYMVAWSGDSATTTGEYEIYAQRLTGPLASLSGLPIRVSRMGTDGDKAYAAFWPHITYNSRHNEYMVTWMGDQNSGGLVDEEYEIYIQRLYGDLAQGNEIGGNVRLSQMGPDGSRLYAAYRPRIAYSALQDVYGITWRGDHNTGSLIADELEIYVQNVYGDRDLGNLLGTVQRISDMGSTDGSTAYQADKPAIAYSPASDSFLLLWQGDDETATSANNEFEIFGQRYQAGISCYVESSGDNAADYASSDASALQNALNAATPGGFLKVAGTCQGTTTVATHTQSVSIDKEITLQGGYAVPDASGSYWLDPPDSRSHPTLVDAANTGRVIYVTATGNANLQYLTLLNGLDPAQGGGVYNAGILTLTGTTLKNSQAPNGGGLYNAAGGQAILLSSLLSANTSTSGWGGAIYNLGTLTIRNSTLSANTGDNNTGGGLYSEGTATLVHATLSNNAGGGYVVNAGTLNQSNNVIAGNRNLGSLLDPQANCAALPAATVNDQGYNVFGAATGCGIGANSLSVDNSLVFSQTLQVLNNYGGPTDSHRLQTHSAAIDAVPLASCSETHDQRGQLRQQDWACDSGAVEMQFTDSDTVGKTVSGPGTYTFGPTLAKVQVIATGSCLTDLSIQRLETNHPQATTSNLKTGRYWAITPGGCSSGFDVTLILPSAFVPDASDKLCRWNSSSLQWDCGLDTDHMIVAGPTAMPNAISRQNIQALSNWTIGDHVNPTNIQLKSWSAQSGIPITHLVLSGGLLGLALAALIWVRSRKQM